MTERDVPSVITVLTIVAFGNLVLPVVAQLLEEDLGASGHATRALSAGAVILMVLVLWWRYDAHNVKWGRTGLVLMTLLSLFTLLSVPPGIVDRASILIALPVLLIPALAAMFSRRS